MSVPWLPIFKKTDLFNALTVKPKTSFTSSHDEYDPVRAKRSLQHDNSFVFGPLTDIHHLYDQDHDNIAPTRNVTPLSSRACSSEVSSMRLSGSRSCTTDVTSKRFSFRELPNALLTQQALQEGDGEEEEEEDKGPEVIEHRPEVIEHRPEVIEHSDYFRNNLCAPQPGRSNAQSAANEVAPGNYPAQADGKALSAQDRAEVAMQNRRSCNLLMTLLLPDINKKDFSLLHQTLYTGILASAFGVSKDTVSLRTVASDILRLEASIWGWKNETAQRKAIRDLESGALLSNLNERIGRVDLVQWTNTDTCRNQSSSESDSAHEILSTMMSCKSSKNKQQTKHEVGDGPTTSLASEKHRRIRDTSLDGMDSFLLNNGIRCSEKSNDSKPIKSVQPTCVRVKEFRMSGSSESANDDIETVSTATLPRENIQKSYSFTECSHHPGYYVKKKMSFIRDSFKWDCCELRDKHAPFCHRGPPKHHAGKYTEFIWPCCQEIFRTAPGCVEGHNADSQKLLNNLQTQYSSMELNNSKTSDEDASEDAGGSWKVDNHEETELQDISAEESDAVIASDTSRLYEHGQQRERLLCVPCTSVSASDIPVPSTSVTPTTLPGLPYVPASVLRNVCDQRDNVGDETAFNTQENSVENYSYRTVFPSNSISRPITQLPAEDRKSDMVEQIDGDFQNNQIDDMSRWPGTAVQSVYFLGKTYISYDIVVSVECSFCYKI